MIRKIVAKINMQTFLNEVIEFTEGCEDLVWMVEQFKNALLYMAIMFPNIEYQGCFQ